MIRQRLSIALLALLLAACASRPQRDGPDARPPSNLDQVPDATPRVEPLRSGGPNKPYEVLGRRYSPLNGDEALEESGLASWYGRKFHGRPTASGEPYDMYAMTAAHKTMPIPSYARVRNPANGREVIVRINDRGPFESGRVIDLSYVAAHKLGVLAGVAPVQVQRLTFDEIRRGRPQPAALPPDDPAPGERAAQVDAPGFWLQLGAFRAREAALQLQERAQREAGELLPALLVAEEAAWFRLRAGPYASRAAAQRAADELRSRLALDTLLLDRR